MERVLPHEESHAAVVLERARKEFPDDGFVIISEHIDGTFDITSNLDGGPETIRALEYAIHCVKEGMELKRVKP